MTTEQASRILPEDEVVAAILRGGVIAIPTETVYGLACDPVNAGAVERIYEIKHRPADLELTLLAADAEDFVGLVEMPPEAVRLAGRFWPGPLSIIVWVGDIQTAVPRRGTTVSCRVPDHAALRELLRRTGPLATTSANLHGQPPALSAADVAAELGHDVDAILDGGVALGLPSTIIDCTVTPARMLREGPISATELLPPADDFTAKTALRATDPEIATLMDDELQRQEETLELIPSENLASVAVLEALGSWLNNKYAEGVPGKRYYGGCQVVDKIENLARDRAKELFGAEYANVQPHSGSQANMAVYASVLSPGDTMLGMALDQGGHLTHGSPVNFSGKLYHVEPYFVSEETGLLDMEDVRRRAREVQPKMIVAGYSSYPRILDFPAFAEIAQEVGALLMVDMAHFAGLVAAGVHPSPVPYADFVTLTTHKTMRGPWGGMILCKAQYGDALDKSVCPGTQGGPHPHGMTAKAVMLKQCMQPEFRDYARQIVVNAKALAKELMDRGAVLTTGGTDNHLMVIDLRPYGLRGRAVQTAFDEVGITVNANTFPGHGGTPFNPNGIRLGTPSVTSRGMAEPEMVEIADLITEMLRGLDDEATRVAVRERSLALCRRFPLPYRQTSAS